MTNSRARSQSQSRSRPRVAPAETQPARNPPPRAQPDPVVEHSRVAVGRAVVFPAWFKPWREVDERLGGGWFGEALLSQLKKMTPKRNPRGRDDPNDPLADISGLLRSVIEAGLNQFPTVSEKEVIDGVRRITAVGKMEDPPEYVPVLYRPLADSTTHGHIQEYAKKHSPVQKTESWLMDERAVLPKWTRLCVRAVEDVGRELVEEVTAARMNVIEMLKYARQAWNYCQPGHRVTRTKFLQNAVRVQFQFRDQENMKSWVRYRCSPSFLCDRILKVQKLGRPPMRKGD